MRALVPLVLLVALGLSVAVSIAGSENPPPDPTTITVTSTTSTTTTRTRTIVSRFQGRPARYWARRYWAAHRDVRRARRSARAVRRTLLSDANVVEAINLACAVFGDCSTLWRKAQCESRLSPGARNPSGASGLFQFLPSTWRTTPFGVFSIWSPYASALAAGWMHAHGRGGEWSCR